MTKLERNVRKATARVLLATARGCDKTSEWLLTSESLHLVSTGLKKAGRGIINASLWLKERGL